jgi:glycosyltransferase involved in cell wall biosynthesis
MSLKILVVTNMYPTVENANWGTFIWHQVKYLEKLGNTVDVYYINGRKSKISYLKAFFIVFMKTLKTRYDVIHAHHGLAGFVSLFRFRAPLVITFHGSDVLLGKIQPILSRMAAKLSDASIVVSQKIATIVPGFVIPCGVDTTVFKPMDSKEARLKIGFPLNEKIVLFPFDPARKLKRYDLAESAVDQLKKRGYPVLLQAGWNIENSMMPYYYAAADVMVLCSDSEGSPTSIKEALSCNIPVVSIDVGDVVQIMKGIEGVVICKKTSEEIAKGIESVLFYKSANSFDGRSEMIKRYDQYTIISSIIRIYKNVQRSG